MFNFLVNIQLFISSSTFLFNIYHLFKVQLFIQRSIVQLMFKTYYPTFNDLFSIQLFSQHSIIHSVFNFLLLIRLS